MKTLPSLEERLRALPDKFVSESFLKGTGISNEDNIYIFAYDAENEMQVQASIETWQGWAKAENVYFCNLYEEYLNLCKANDILGGIIELEASDGSVNILDQLQESITMEDFAKYLAKGFEDSKKKIFLIHGVGDVFPFARVHSLLNALPVGIEKKAPIIVFYPGLYNGHELRLFNQLERNGYYRAFSILE